MKQQFSVFPTTYWAESSIANNVAIIWHKPLQNDLAILDQFPSQFSWTDWQYWLEQVQYFLQTLGIKPNQTIAYYGDVKIIGLMCYCATIALGSRILMLNPALTQSQRQTILTEHSVDFLITDESFAKFTPNLTAYHTINFSQCCFTNGATLTLTSGSSGTPKAVVHSVDAHLANAEGVCQLMAFVQSNSWLLTLPLFHVSGQGIVWRWLLKGATLYIDENKSTLLYRLNEVTHASLVPTQLQRYLQTLSSPLPIEKHFLLGGATIPRELIEQAKQHHLITYAGYGMTEMASTITAVKNETDNVGTPLTGRECCIVNGEIWVRGASLALGYWQKGEIIPIVNENGWLATKDRGEWNQNGYLIVKGRIDNMFISGGENIQPEDVEQCLFQSGLVKQIFIVPVPDPEFGVRPVAFVEFKQEHTLQTVNILQQFAKTHLEGFKRPIAYFPLENQWQQNNIKISRVQLKQLAQQKFLQ